MIGRLLLLLTSLTPFLLGCSEGTPGSIPLRHVAFSPDGKWLAAAGGTIKPDGGEGILKVWETASWKAHANWSEGFSDYVQQLFFQSNEAVGALSNDMVRGKPGKPLRGVVLRSWNLPEKLELESSHMKGLRADAGFVGYYPAAKIIAGPGQQNGCAIRNLPKLDEKVALKGDLRAATLMRFSRDGKNVAVGIKSPETPELQIFNAERGELIRAHKLIASKVFATPTEVRTVAFSPDGTMIAAGTIEPKKIYVFDGNANELLAFDVKSAPDCLDFTPDNLFLAFKKSRNTVELISVKTKKTQRTFSDNPEGANGWCFSPDGAWIAIASGGHPQGSGKSPGKVRVFEVKTGKLVAVLD